MLHGLAGELFKLELLKCAISAGFFLLALGALVLITLPRRHY